MFLFSFCEGGVSLLFIFFFFIVSFIYLFHFCSVAFLYCISAFLCLFFFIACLQFFVLCRLSAFLFSKAKHEELLWSYEPRPEKFPTFRNGWGAGKEKCFFSFSSFSTFLFFLLHFIFFIWYSSSALSQLFFRQSRKEKLQKKAALSRKEIVRCFRVMEIIGSGGCGAGTRRFVGLFLLCRLVWGSSFSFCVRRLSRSDTLRPLQPPACDFLSPSSKPLWTKRFLMSGDVLLGD